MARAKRSPSYLGYRIIGGSGRTERTVRSDQKSPSFQRAAKSATKLRTARRANGTG